MIDIINTPEKKLPDDMREIIAKENIENTAQYNNAGLLMYYQILAPSGAELPDTEWTGEGSIVRDIFGRELIDMMGGYAVFSAGLRHPKIIEAVKNQMDRLCLYSHRMNDPLRGQLSKVLAFLTPGDLQYSFFCNGGCEAVEGAMKMAKVSTGKHGFISTIGGFHGKSLGALSLMGKSAFTKQVRPLLPDVYHVDFGDAAALEKGLATARAVGQSVGAFVVEPVQGEGGVIIPPDDYFPRVRELCDYYDVVFIADEIQTGMGRTGKVFCIDHWDVTPDIMLLGKALGGGVLPMAGFIANRKIWKKLYKNPALHTSTFGGHALGCAASLAFIELMLEEEFPKQATEKGEYMRQKLNELQEDHEDLMTDVRGIGLLTGVQFQDEESSMKMTQALSERGVMVAGTLVSNKTFRLAPALNIPYELIDKTLDAFEDALEEIDF